MLHRTSLLPVLALLFLFPVSALASKISADIQRADQGKPLDVIVLYKATATNTDKAKLTGKGAVVTGSFDKVKSVAYRVNPRELAVLESDPGVVYVSAVRPMKVHMLPIAEQTTGSYIAPSYSLTGAGIGVAVIDSGVTLHPDLKQANCSGSRIVYSQSFVSGDTATADAYGHGTHIASIIAGNGLCSGTTANLAKMIGMAPSANIINLRVLNSFGIGTDAGVIAAINRAIELKATHNIRIINLSLGRFIRESYTLDPLAQAVESAVNAGILVVSSAGNFGRNTLNGLNGYGSLTSPGNHPLALTVGAMNMKATDPRSDDVITSFSGKGPSALDHIVKPDIVAPGNVIGAANVTGSTLAELFASNIVTSGYPSGKYISLSGTSMAAPMVSGAAALVLQQTPALTPAQVKARLMRTASKTFPSPTTYTVFGSSVPLVCYYDPFTIGAGYLDILAALNDTATSTPGSLSPAIVQSGSNVSLIDAPSATKAQKVNWVNSAPAIYGSLNVSSGNVQGATGKAWGDTSVSGYTVLWGDSVLWGDTILWGDTVLWGDTILWGDVFELGDPQ